MRSKIWSDRHNATHTRRPPDRHTEGVMHGAGWGTIHTERQRNTKAVYPRKGVNSTEVGYTEGFYTRRGTRGDGLHTEHIDTESHSDIRRKVSGEC